MAVTAIPSVSEPIDLADVRSYLSMREEDTTDDALLSSAISFCRDRLEQILPYSLACMERTLTVRSYSETAFELRGPVTAVCAVEIVGADTMALTVDQWRQSGEVVIIDGSALPCGPFIVRITYQTGVHCPPVVRNALLMMVKNRYERRDEDPLTSAVISSVAGEMRLNA